MPLFCERQTRKTAAEFCQACEYDTSTISVQCQRLWLYCANNRDLFQRLYAIEGIQGAISDSGHRQIVTKLADQGINAHMVQTLAHHKHLSTTQRCIDVNENALRNAVELVGVQYRVV